MTAASAASSLAGGVTSDRTRGSISGGQEVFRRRARCSGRASPPPPSSSTPPRASRTSPPDLTLSTSAGWSPAGSRPCRGRSPPPHTRCACGHQHLKALRRIHGDLVTPDELDQLIGSEPADPHRPRAPPAVARGRSPTTVLPASGRRPGARARSPRAQSKEPLETTRVRTSSALRRPNRSPRHRSACAPAVCRGVRAVAVDRVGDVCADRSVSATSNLGQS